VIPRLQKQERIAPELPTWLNGYKCRAEIEPAHQIHAQRTQTPEMTDVLERFASAFVVNAAG
jgi:hypothetical protein